MQDSKEPRGPAEGQRAMCARALHGDDAGGQKRRGLFPTEFVRILGVVWVVPAFLLGGALLGYAADRLFGTFPFLTALALLIALALAVRDLLRLRDGFHGGDADEPPS